MNTATLQHWLRRCAALSQAERAGLYAEAGLGPDLRAQIESLLAAEHTPTAELGAAGLAGPAAKVDELPARIGPYRVLRKLGEGGMGVVLLGERDDGEFRRRVAIKLMAGVGGTHARERFLRERQTLAGLEHPGIARLYEGGTGERGEPYLVMEFVDGEPLLEWLGRKPSLAQRLHLFVAVCAAVHHAHQNLVIHRDIKPANVLVRGDGSPALLDFGIARLVDPDGAGEATVTRAMTPAYASPEQLLGQPLTTASDIYALGLLLYVLLLGRTPPRGDAARTLTHELPGPSRLAAAPDAGPLALEAAQLRGELDAIVRRAVRSDPQRRYPSAAALAADIEAYLQGRPVAAVGTHWRYLAGKFVRRHRVGVAASLLGLALLAAVGVQLKLQRDRAVAAERSARLEAETSAAVTEYLTALFEELDPNVHPGRELSARELLEIGRDRLELVPAERQAVRAQLEHALGRIYANIGQWAPALALLESARQRLPPGPSVVRARTLGTLARTLNQAQRHVEALPVAEAAVADAAQLGGADGLVLAHALMERGVTRQALEHTEAAAADFDRARAAFEAAGEPGREGLASVLHNRAWIDENRDDFEAALAGYRRAHEVKQALLGADHPKSLNSQMGYGRALARMQRHAEAAAVFEDLRERTLRVHGPESEPAQSIWLELGSVHQDLGDYARAQEHYQRALALARRLTDGEPTLGVAVLENNLASLLEEREDLAGAEALYRNSLATRRQVLPAGHLSVARTAHNLARTLLAAGRGAAPEVGELIAEAAQARASLPEGHGDRVATDLLQLRRELALDPGRAQARALEAAAWLVPELHPAVRAYGHELLADLALARGDPAAAAAQLEQAVAAVGAARVPGHPLVWRMQLRLAHAWLAQGQRERAEPLLREAAAIVDRALAPAAPSRALLAPRPAP